jgi:hypothetical protein
MPELARKLESDERLHDIAKAILKGEKKIINKDLE